MNGVLIAFEVACLVWAWRQFMRLRSDAWKLDSIDLRNQQNRRLIAVLGERIDANFARRQP